MKKKIFITECSEVKTGFGKNGKPWTLYRVVSEDGTKYSTFDEKYLGMVNSEVEIEYEEKQNGKFTNRTIIEPRKYQASHSTGSRDAILVNMNEQILDRLDTIIELMTEKIADKKDFPL